MKLFFLLGLVFFVSGVNAQKPETKEQFERQRDSLIHALMPKLSIERQEEYKQIMREDTASGKDMVFFMLLTPRSSKKEMVANIDSNYKNINTLKTAYQQLVPKGYIVYIEFNAGDFYSKKESYDIKISRPDNSEKPEHYWHLDLHSSKMQLLLRKLGWNDQTVMRIRELLKKANCISVENGNITSIGFARSGLGKYSFSLFSADLNDDQKAAYNDGCSYIFYKKNIVLQYGGGAAGPQCFPDKD